MNANDRQVGGDHYGPGEEFQHWDIVAEFGLDYFQGQITKYVMRWRSKNGVEDLKKARHFLDKYIEVAEKNEARLQALKAGACEAGPGYVGQD